MSQPGLPSEIVGQIAAAGDDLSAVSTTTGVAAASIDMGWLTPFDAVTSLFKKPALAASRSRSKISPIWSFFTLLGDPKEDVDPDDLPDKVIAAAGSKAFVCCNLCGAVVGYADKDAKTGNLRNSSNSVMHNHLKSGKHNTTLKILESSLLSSKMKASTASVSSSATKKPKVQTSIASFATKVEIPLHLRKQHQELMTVKFIASNMLPFSVVESASFRDMILAHNKHAAPMSNKKVKDCVLNLESFMRDSAVKKLEGLSVCVTLDHWTSKANQTYTGFTAHYIDNDFKLHNLNLGIHLHEGGTKAEELEFSFLELVLNKLKLSKCKLFAATTDTTANMNKFGVLLEDRGVSHLYCTDHVLQLTAKLCYEKKNKNNVGLSDVIGQTFTIALTKARKIVSFINKSSQAKTKLLKIQIVFDPNRVAVTVITDVVTRWWSTFLMLQRLLRLRQGITMMGTEGDLGDCALLEPTDWDNLDKMVKILTPFKDGQLLLEGDTYVTSSWVPKAIGHVAKVLAKFSSEGEDVDMKYMAKNLLGDFRNRWGNEVDEVFTGTVKRGSENRQIGIHPVFWIAHFLDPRFKLLNVPQEQSKENIKGHVLKLMMELQQENQQQDVVPMVPEPLAAAEEEDDLFASIDAAANAAEGQEVQQGISVEDSCKAEMQLYLNLPRLQVVQGKVNGKNVFHNPLLWWQQHKGKLPVLAQLAQIYLAVQASSAPSERVFSKASLLLSNLRSSMNPNIASSMMFVSENWHLWNDKELIKALYEDEQGEDEDDNN